MYMCIYIYIKDTWSAERASSGDDQAGSEPVWATAPSLRVGHRNRCA